MKMILSTLPRIQCKRYSHLFVGIKKHASIAKTKFHFHQSEGKLIHSLNIKAPWNILFFGTDAFAVESLKCIYHESKTKQIIQRLEVVTSIKDQTNPVTRFAQENHIPIKRWPLDEKISDFHIGIVASFGHLIPSNIIESFPLGMLNVHASLLPKLRGAAPIVHAIINGDTCTGITIMKIRPKKFDIGEIVTQERTEIHLHETLPELYSKLAKQGGNLIVHAIRKLPEILTHATPQDPTEVTYAPKITSEISWIKWNEMTARNIYNLNRGLIGLYALKAKFRHMTIKLFDIEIGESPKLSNITNEPGSVIYSRSNQVLLVKCKGDSWISVKKIILPGRPSIAAKDFNAGFIANNKGQLIFFK